MLSSNIATVFGGSGFVGRYVIHSLARLGYTIRVPTRYPASAGFLRTAGVVGQVTPVPMSLRDTRSIHAAVKNSTLVINLVGELTANRRNSFEFIQAESAGRIARAAAAEGAARLVHLSAIGANPDSRSAYAASKGHGEAQVREAFSDATILRPSIVFGPEDQFFNRFAAMAALVPAIPLIGGGKTKFQPVYVADIAEAVVHAAAHADTAGKIYELGGPDVFSFRQLMELMLKQIDRKAIMLPVPFAIASLQARFLELVPGKPLTRDQVELLKHDNVVSAGALTFADMGISPTALEIVLPTYLDRFAKGGRFHSGTHVDKYYA